MTSARQKGIYYLLEGLNSFGTTYYYFYLFFFMEREYGFGNRENLALSALNGFFYMMAAWLGGRFGQRVGYYHALAAGLITMVIALTVGCFVSSSAGHLSIMVLWTLGISFTWPTLEALISEGETPSGLQQVLGLYNVVWAGVGALTFLIGGFLLENLGWLSLFWLPVGIHLLQLAILAWLWRQPPSATSSHPGIPNGKHPLNPRPIARTKAFLKMARFANPFAYVSINTIVAVVPGIARELQLSAAVAGLFCSIWFLARAASFVLLWIWGGWHYRFRWLLAAYLVLVTSFASILLSSSVWMIGLAQVAFGLSLGLIYYSSLYYSMDVAETKGEHGGFHESAIGLGIFAGPAVGALSLTAFPERPNIGTTAVTVLLLIGLAGVLMFYASYRGFWRNRNRG